MLANSTSINRKPALFQHEHDSLEKDDSAAGDVQRLAKYSLGYFYFSLCNKHLSFIDTYVNCDFIIIIINLQFIHLEDEI